MLKQDAEQVLGWIKRLYPPDTPGLVWIGSKSTNFRGERFGPQDTPAMLREVAKRDRDPGVFIRMSTIRPEAEKRGTAEDSVAVAGFWADIDIEGPGHKHDPDRYEGRQLPPDQAAAELIVKSLPEPSAWIASGGGFYPMWLPAKPWVLGTDCSAEDWGRLSVDLQTVIYEAAKLHGWHFGMGTGDIARVLRIPGTINRKVPVDPKRCDIDWGGGPLYTFEQLRQAIPEAPTVRQSVEVMSRVDVTMAPIPKLAPRRVSRFAAPASPFEEQPRAVGPLDDFAQRNDLNDLLVADGWTLAYEHQGRRQYARPGKDPKDGVSGNVVDDGGRQVLYVFSEGAGLPTMRGLSVGEWYAHRHHGGDLRQAARTLRLAGYGTPPTTTPAAPPVNREGPGVSEAPAQVPALVQATTEDIWGRRPILGAIRNIAWERMVGPWAVLGGVLAQVACRIGPHMQLPPIVGGNASLNMFIGLVGPSGAGKDAATAVAAELLGVAGKIPTKKLGTGQGIDASFTAQSQKEGPIQYNDVALFTIAEIDSLAAHSQMNGSTLMSTLREVYTGSALGAHYADKFKRRPVGQHRYRAAVLAGIQPTRAGTLLDDADGGTPQRWIWLPTNDDNPEPPARRLMAPARDHWWTDYAAWMPNGENPDDEPIMPKDPTLIGVAQTAWDTIRANRAAVLRRSLTEQAEGLGGHALLTKLKVAALLGFLDGRASVNEEDWELAGIIMTRSEHTRGICQDEMNRKARQSSVGRGRSRALQAIAEQEETEQIKEDKVAKLQANMLAKLQDRGDWMTARELRAWAGRRRNDLPGALEALQEQGLIEQQTEGTSTRYRSVTK